MNRTLIDGEDIVILTLREVAYLQNGASMTPDPPYMYMVNGKVRNPQVALPVVVDESESDGGQIVRLDISEYLQDEAGQVYYRIVGGRPRSRKRS